MDAPQPNRTSPSDIAFRDPLSEETRRVRTQLLFAGALGVLVSTYDLRVTKAPWLEFEIPQSAPQLLSGALSAALCYLLLVFCFYAWQDFRRWRLAGEIHLLHGSFDLILQARNDLFAISQHLDGLTCEEPLQEQIRAAISAAATRLPQSQATLLELRSSLRRLNAMQWFRVIVIEIGFPAVLGAFALLRMFDFLVPFVRAVVH